MLWHGARDTLRRWRWLGGLELVLALRRFLVVAGRGGAGALGLSLERRGLFGVLARLLSVAIGLGGVVLGLLAVGVGSATGLLRAGDARVRLLAMSGRLSREALVLDLALGVATTSHGCRERQDDDDRDDNDDDQDC